MEQEHPALLRVYYKPLKRRSQGCKRKRALTRRILSLIETAKQNGIAPEDYLRCLFEKAPYAETENDWKKLLPWNIEITPYKIRGEWI